MIRLTGKLALSNLVKNRKLYYPFALATCLAVAISYIFFSLTFNPHLAEMAGASAVSMVLALGLIIVSITTSIIVFYANSFVIKNRSKELGLYSMLGLNRFHLFIMMIIELIVFGLVTLIIGLGLGLLFDQLIYALLLKIMDLKVVLTSTFQPLVLFLVTFFYGFVFFFLMIKNGLYLRKLDALQLVKEKNSGEKKSRFLGLQTILGLASLIYGYYLASGVTNPIAAILVFFVAVLFVILGTYLLFNAGITKFLHFLQKRKNYYYQPNNMISVSNLIFRMKKNAVGLATITILSTMVLVTLSGGANIYAGGEYMQNAMFPHDISLQGKGVNGQQIDQVLTEFSQEQNLPVTKKAVYQYYTMGVKSLNGNQLDLYPSAQKAVAPNIYILAISEADYQDMTGKSLNLEENEVAVFQQGLKLKNQETLTIADQTLKIKKVLKEDFIFGHLPDQMNMIVPGKIYMVVKDPSKTFASMMEKYAVNSNYYGGLNLDLPKDQQSKLRDAYQEKLSTYNTTLPENHAVYGSISTSDKQEIKGMLGGMFFIGIFLSVVFMLGTVLIIYYKQISEGYEDRDRFVILQKVGLDGKQIKQTIRRQILIVFFLPLAFAFIHLAFAYHMLSLILSALGVLNASLMLAVTLGVCAIFFISYIIVFAITSRSYRKIISM